MWLGGRTLASRLTRSIGAQHMAPKRRVGAKAAPQQPDAGPDAAQPAAKRSRAEKKPHAKADDGSAQAAAQPAHFLMKSEPDVFSLDDLAAKPDQTEHWDGVRSHQAKKVMQSMRVGDQAFFYHSNAKPPGIVGLVEVVREAYPDHTQWEPTSEYYDASSSQESPKWFMVDVQLVRRLRRQISLEELKRHAVAGPLADMALVRQGRLSVQPVTAAQWAYVLALEDEEPEAA